MALTQIRSRKRLIVTGKSAVYHVMSRTAFQKFAFEAKDKEVFCSLLRKQAAFSGIEILTFCVMSNHFHILLRVPLLESLPDSELIARYSEYYKNDPSPKSVLAVGELKKTLAEGGPTAQVARTAIISRMANLPAFMRELKQRFSIWFNAHHQNSGTIWSARYKSVLVEDTPETLTKVAGYIDLNPVRAELVDDPADYRWCGYAQAIAGLDLARAGVIGVYGQSKSYSQCIQSYRLIIFGQGYYAKGKLSKDHGRISGEQLREIIAKNGEVSLHEMLRARIRYFCDGLVLGSHHFVREQFEANRASYGPNRVHAGTSLKGSCWDGMASLRDLQKDVYV